jgi:transcriptional regulator with XRE-family HTH domain
MNPLSKAVARALTDAPLSIREIARRAKVSHVLLVGILAGSRNATPTVAEAIARALDAVGKDCAKRTARIWPLLEHGGSQ